MDKSRLRTRRPVEVVHAAPPQFPEDDVLNTYLAHYGVKGMKWGRRRGESGGGSAKTAKKTPRPVSEDHAMSRELRKKRVSEMSNAELKKLNERMQLEASYDQLMKKTGGTQNEGQARLKKLMDIGKTAIAIDKAMGSPGTQAIKKALTATK